MASNDRTEYRRRRKKKSSKKWIAVLILLVIAALLYYFLILKKSAPKEQFVYIEDKVQRGTLMNGIEESGSVTLDESGIQYDLTITTSDDDDDDDDDDEDSNYLKIEEVYVAKGQRISEGDSLFKLTSSSIRSVRRILEANVSDAAVSLAEANSSYTLDSQTAANTAGASLADAQVADTLYEVSIAELKNMIESYSAENEALEKDIKICQENIADEEFRKCYGNAQTLYENALEKYNATDAHNVEAYLANYNAYISAKNTLEGYETKVDTWQETIDTDMNKVEKNKIAMNKAIAALEYKTQSAESTRVETQIEGALANETYNNTVNSLGETVSEAQNAYKSACDELDAFNAFVGEDGIIKSDGAGLVVTVNYEAGDELKSKGAMLTYTKGDGYTISIDVSEEDIPQIYVGEEVNVTFTAYEDVEYKGIVSIIGTSASSNSKTVSYPVTVEIEGDTSILFGGMTAMVTFSTEKKDDVLYVSSKAITDNDGHDAVYVKQNGEYILWPVTKGISNGISTEILTGLSEGDVVYIRSTATGGDYE